MIKLHAPEIQSHHLRFRMSFSLFKSRRRKPRNSFKFFTIVVKKKSYFSPRQKSEFRLSIEVEVYNTTSYIWRSTKKEPKEKDN